MRASSGRRRLCSRHWYFVGPHEPLAAPSARKSSACAPSLSAWKYRDHRNALAASPQRLSHEPLRFYCRLCPEPSPAQVLSRLLAVSAASCYATPCAAGCTATVCAPWAPARNGRSQPWPTWPPRWPKTKATTWPLAASCTHQSASVGGACCLWSALTALFVQKALFDHVYGLFNRAQVNGHTLSGKGTGPGTCLECIALPRELGYGTTLG